jgi:tetratricopeptide (TPR) repeat protein
VARRIGRLSLLGLLACGLVLSGCAGGTHEGGPAPGASGESLDTILSHADGAMRDGDYQEAALAYEQALQRSPDHPAATANLASCYLRLRTVIKAQELLTSYLGRQPGDPAARLVLARVWLRQGDLDKAAEALREVVRVKPDVLLAQYNLGFIAYRSRHYDEAEEHLRAAIALQPDHVESYYTLGLTLVATGRVDEAIASFERVLALEPKHVGAHFNLAGAYARAGRMKEAGREQAAYGDLSGRSKAHEEKETQIATTMVKAIQLVNERNYPGALTEYLSLAGRYPDHAPIRLEIGRLQVRLGQRREALETLKAATALDPNLSEPHYLLAGLYRETGDTAAADRELQIFATLEVIPEGKSAY